MEPVTFTGTAPPCTKQYPLNPTAMKGIMPVIEQLEEKGIIVKINSASNSPVWPVKKTDGSWRHTIDYRVANQYIDKITPLVADITTIFRLIKPEHKWFSVIDMANRFWSVPLAKDLQGYTIKQSHIAFTI